MKNIDEWVLEILQEVIDNKEITALNFGLFESQEGYKIYCIGSTWYSDIDSTWACDESFSPKRKYLSMKDDLNKLPWELFQKKICQHLDEVIKEHQDMFADNLKYICCGFDDGDLVVIWQRLI